MPRLRTSVTQSSLKTIVVPHPPLTTLCADIVLILRAMQQQIPMSSVIDSAEESV